MPAWSPTRPRRRRTGPSRHDDHLEPVVDEHAGRADRLAPAHQVGCGRPTSNGDGATDLGDPIQWSFLVTNTGTTTLTGVAVNDPTAGAVTCPATTLAPGASTTCTADDAHTDHPGRRRRRRGVATRRRPRRRTRRDATVTSNPSSTATPVAQTPALPLTKSAAVTDVERRRQDRPRRHDHLVVPGDEHAARRRSRRRRSTTPRPARSRCPVTTLAPGASTTCTARGLHDHPGRRRCRRGRPTPRRRAARTRPAPGASRRRRRPTPRSPRRRR